MSSVWFAWDPGSAKGAIAVVTDAVAAAAWSISKNSPTDLAEVIRVHTEVIDVRGCLVEIVGPRPGEAPSRAYNFGKGAGIVEGLFVANGIRRVHMVPRSWQKIAGCVQRKRTGQKLVKDMTPKERESRKRAQKDIVKAKAQALFPRLMQSASGPPSDKRITKENCDAIVMAWAAWQSEHRRAVPA